MSTATSLIPMTASAPLELSGPLVRVPPLEVLRWLTAVPEQRVVFHDKDWAFYEELVDSIPEGSNLHVDYDGRDLEVMSTGRRHGKRNKLLGQFVEAVAQVLSIPYSSLADTTWKRPEIARGSAVRPMLLLPPREIWPWTPRR